MVQLVHVLIQLIPQHNSKFVSPKIKDKVRLRRFNVVLFAAERITGIKWITASHMPSVLLRKV